MNHYPHERGIAEQTFKLALIAYLLYVCYQMILFITGGSWVDTTILTALVAVNITASFWVIVELGNVKGELGNVKGELVGVKSELGSVKTEMSRLAERMARVEAKIRV